MDFKVILQPLALNDLEAIVRHVAEKDVQAANRLGMSLLDAAESSKDQAPSTKETLSSKLQTSARTWH